MVGYTFSYPYQGKKREFVVERPTPEGGRMRVDLVGKIGKEGKEAREPPMCPGVFRDGEKVTVLHKIAVKA